MAFYLNLHCVPVRGSLVFKWLTPAVTGLPKAFTLSGAIPNDALVAKVKLV